MFSTDRDAARSKAGHLQPGWDGDEKSAALALPENSASLLSSSSRSDSRGTNSGHCHVPDIANPNEAGDVYRPEWSGRLQPPVDLEGSREPEPALVPDGIALTATSSQLHPARQVIDALDVSTAEDTTLLPHQTSSLILDAAAATAQQEHSCCDALLATSDSDSPSEHEPTAGLSRLVDSLPALSLAANCPQQQQQRVAATAIKDLTCTTKGGSSSGISGSAVSGREGAAQGCSRDVVRVSDRRHERPVSIDSSSSQSKAVDDVDNHEEGGGNGGGERDAVLLTPVGRKNLPGMQLRVEAEAGAVGERSEAWLRALGPEELLAEFKKLQEDHEKYRREVAFQKDLLASVGQAVICTDLQGTITYWNTAAEVLYGWKEWEAVGRNIMEITPAETTVQQATEIFEKLSQGEVWTGEFLVRRRDMTQFHAMVTDTPILDQQSQLIGIIGVSADISEMKRKEQQIRALNAELEGRVAERTQQLQRSNAALKVEIQEHLRAREHLQKCIEDLEQSRDKISEQSEALEKLVEDLRVARYEAESANRLKSRFLASMSHEIRTPMNGVLGMTNLILSTPLSEEQRQFVDTIRCSGDALLTIINDILDMSKIEAGELELEQRDFELGSCVEDAVNILAVKAMEKGIELVSFVDPSVPSILKSDSSRLRQIIVNLLSNAIKFTDEGEVELRVSATPLSDVAYWAGQGGPRYEMFRFNFSVRDTGIGIAADRMDRLFKPFSQLDASMTRKYGGTGLGLIISRQLVELLGGEIWAESSGEGKGSTFSLFIVAPAVVPTLPDHTASDQLVPSLSPRFGAGAKGEDRQQAGVGGTGQVEEEEEAEGGEERRGDEEGEGETDEEGGGEKAGGGEDKLQLDAKEEGSSDVSTSSKDSCVEEGGSGRDEEMAERSGQMEREARSRQEEGGSCQHADGKGCQVEAGSWDAERMGRHSNVAGNGMDRLSNGRAGMELEEAQTRTRSESIAADPQLQPQGSLMALREAASTLSEKRDEANSDLGCDPGGAAECPLPGTCQPGRQQKLRGVLLGAEETEQGTQKKKKKKRCRNGEEKEAGGGADRKKGGAGAAAAAAAATAVASAAASAAAPSFLRPSGRGASPLNLKSQASSSQLQDALRSSSPLKEGNMSCDAASGAAAVGVKSSERKSSVAVERAELPEPSVMRRETSGVPALMEDLWLQNQQQPSLSCNWWKGKRVVVLDEHEVSRRMISSHLESFGAKVEPVATASEAEFSLGCCSGSSRGESSPWAKERVELLFVDSRIGWFPSASNLKSGRYSEDSPLWLVILAQYGSKPEIPELSNCVTSLLSKPVRQSQLSRILLQKGQLSLSAQNSQEQQQQQQQQQKPQQQQLKGTGGTAAARGVVLAGDFQADLATRSPLKILLAEDNIVNQKVATKTLGRMGYACDVAKNGQEALHALEKNSYDLILMDVQMPVMDGIEATQRIISTYSPESRPVIFAMTANVLETDRALCLNAGMDGFIAKPIHVKELVRAIQYCTHKKLTQS